MSELNRAWWDERVPLHTGSDFYDVEGFKAGRDPLRTFEVEELGDVRGRTLVHLQCHFGLDTLAWARRGARVSGLDFSAPAIEAAGALAAEIGIDADFVVAALLEPGGVLYLSEFHPFQWVCGDDELTIEYDYFHHQVDLPEEPGTYASVDAATVDNRTEEWQHPLSDVVSALIDSGLTLELLHEHDYTLFPRWPFLEKSGFDAYRLPEGRPRLPLMYSLRARAGLVAL